MSRAVSIKHLKSIPAPDPKAAFQVRWTDPDGAAHYIAIYSNGDAKSCCFGSAVTIINRIPELEHKARLLGLQGAQTAGRIAEAFANGTLEQQLENLVRSQL